MHSVMAHDTVKSSNSIIAYLDSASERNLDEGPVIAILLLQHKPKSLTTSIGAKACGFVRIEKGDSGGECESLLGRDESFVKVGDHANSFLVLCSGRREASRLARVAVLADSWLARPKKARRSVWLVGVGKLEIASVTDLSML